MRGTLQRALALLTMSMLAVPVTAGLAAATHTPLPAPLPQGAALDYGPALADEATAIGASLEDFNVAVVTAARDAAGPVACSTDANEVASCALAIAAGQEPVPLPFSFVTAVSHQAFDVTGPEVLASIGRSNLVARQAYGAQADESLSFKNLLLRVAEAKLGQRLDLDLRLGLAEVDARNDPDALVRDPFHPQAPALDPFPSPSDFAATVASSPLEPASSGCVGPGLDAVRAALRLAPEGADLALCPGSYEGTLVIDKPFVTVRSAQGTLSAVIDARGGNGIEVRASGVTLKALTVQGATGPGSAGILVGTPDDSMAGEVLGTLVQDSLVRRNTHGIVVWKAPGTVLLHNTVRESLRAGAAGGVGVYVLEQASPSGLAADLAEDSHGTLLVANNFLHNGRYAVYALAETVLGSPVPVPVVAVANHFGQATGPSVEVAPGLCQAAPLGDPRCRNAVGFGVVLVGFSPVPL